MMKRNEDRIFFFLSSGFKSKRTFALFNRVLNLFDVAVASRAASTSREFLLHT